MSGDSAWLFGTHVSTGTQGYASDLFISTPVTVGDESNGLSSLGIPQCGSAPSSTSTPSSFYDRNAAVAWALANWDHNPLIQNGGDCTWFTSQALWAGGLPQTDEWTSYSDDGIFGSDVEAMARALIQGGYSPTNPINPTHVATDANQNIDYLVSHGLATKTLIEWSDNTAGGAELGDLIVYDWDGGSNGTTDHISIVTTYNEDGYPTVSQHSTNRADRYWSWDPGAYNGSGSFIKNSPNYQPASGSSNGPPRAYLVHITY